MMAGVTTGFRPPINTFLAHPDAGVRLAIGDEIAGTGITVIGEADNGADALAGILDLAPDVALVAFDLSDPDGAEICATLRDELPVCRVLLLSTRDDDATFAALEAGAYGCHLLVEPTLPLVQAIRGTMRRESLPSPRWARLVLDRYAALAAADATRPLPAPTLGDLDRQVLEQLAAGVTPEAVAQALELTTHVVRLHASDAIITLARAATDEQILAALG